MIITDMRLYNFFTFGDSSGYGMPQLSAEPKGKIKMAIYNTSQQVQGNVNYLDSNYIALTNDSAIDDTYVIEYNGNKYKVLYIQPKGRYKQVFLKNYD